MSVGDPPPADTCDRADRFRGNRSPCPSMKPVLQSVVSSAGWKRRPPIGGDEEQYATGSLASPCEGEDGRGSSQHCHRLGVRHHVDLLLPISRLEHPPPSCPPPFRGRDPIWRALCCL